jgi:hypothetical protein
MPFTQTTSPVIQSRTLGSLTTSSQYQGTQDRYSGLRQWSLLVIFDQCRCCQIQSWGLNAQSTPRRRSTGVFSDIPGFSQEGIDSEAGQVAHQGLGNGGDGSCGLAAFNFVERHLDPSIPSWSGQHSQVFRDCALHDLILYHFTAKEASGCVLNWVSRCVPTTKHDMLVNNANGFCGYNDYNLYSPKVCGLCY